jgi:hypothetical protein
MMNADQPISINWLAAANVHIGAFGSIAFAAIAAA